MGKAVAVIIRDPERQYEGLRTSLGLLLENHRIGMYVLDHEIAVSEEYVDNMEYIDEMGGARFSNVPKNTEEHGFVPVTLKEMAAKLDSYDIIIPF